MNSTVWSVSLDPCCAIFIVDNRDQSGIRLAYYDALNGTNQAHGHMDAAKLMSADAVDAKIDAANSHNDPHHVRHCFDYLRQALMVCLPFLRAKCQR